MYLIPASKGRAWEPQLISRIWKSFQEDLCHLVLNDRAFADQMFEVLDLSFLELKHLRVFVKKIKDYRKKYGVHPTSNIMHSIIRTGLDGEAESVKVRIRSIMHAYSQTGRYRIALIISKILRLISAKNKN